MDKWWIVMDKWWIVTDKWWIVTDGWWVVMHSYLEWHIVTCYRKIFYADFLCRRTRIYNYRAPRVLFVRARTLAVWDEFVWRGLQHGDPRWWKLVKMHHFSLKRRGIRAKWALWSENLLYFSSRQEFDAMCESFNNIKTETEAFSKRCREIVSWILLTTTHSLEVA